jgi:hypothetical protein
MGEEVEDGIEEEVREDMDEEMGKWEECEN